jgi:hypothetical protein
MIVATTTVQRSEIQQFLQASLRPIVRAEAQGRPPARFTGTGLAVWETFHSELTPTDLVALCVQDAGVTMPIPFDPGRWWPGWPDWTLLEQFPDDAQRWTDDVLTQTDEPRDAFLRAEKRFYPSPPSPQPRPARAFHEPRQIGFDLPSSLHYTESELVHHCLYYTRNEARADMFCYIESFCNRRRRHSALNYLSPEVYEQHFHQGVLTLA